MIDFSHVLTGAHITFGTVAVFAGALALAVRKGHSNHKNAGRIFALTMVFSSAIGAVLGLLKMESHYITFHAGVLGVTLIASGWLAARSGAGQAAVAGIGFAFINLLNTLALISIAIYASSQPESVWLGFHAADYFFLSGMAGVAAIGDISLFIRGTLTEKQRIARHLWRMCLGFFIAAGSAFTGPGASVFSEAVQRSGILALPELIIICLMFYWLFRTLLQK